MTVDGAKDCMDYTGWGHNAELIYECVQTGEGPNSCKFSAHCFPNAFNSEYCLWCPTTRNNFGCVNLKRKEYCILNKKYSKEEYETLKIHIIEDMKKNPYIDEHGKVWSSGEYFLPAFAPFDYNKSNAMRFMPKSRSEALSMGYSWDDTDSAIVDCTIKHSDLPQTIKTTDDSVLKEIIECIQCKRSYKIVQGELDLLRKMNLPLPHECPKCRENRRFSRMNRPGMYHRTCDKCNINIYTLYASDRPEIVYCVKCYQQEFS